VDLEPTQKQVAQASGSPVRSTLNWQFARRAAVDGGRACQEGPSRCLASLLRLQRPLPAYRPWVSRYAEARPGAAAIIAAEFEGGSMRTSFLRGWPSYRLACCSKQQSDCPLAYRGRQAGFLPSGVIAVRRRTRARAP
jgi:hypothetical protein